MGGSERNLPFTFFQLYSQRNLNIDIVELHSMNVPFVERRMVYCNNHFFNQEFKMIIHSLRIITHYKRYINLPTELIDQLRKRLGLKLTAVWEILYKESDWNDGVFTKTYEYLSNKIGVSRRSVIRYVDQLISLGFLKRKYNHNDNGDSQANSYELDLPPEVLQALKDAPNRNRPGVELDPDYSVQHDLYERDDDFNEPARVADVGTSIGDQKKPAKIDGRDYLALFGGQKPTIGNREGCQDCHPSYNSLNQDINNTTEATPIAALRHEETKKASNSEIPNYSNRIHSSKDVYKTPKSVTQGVVNKVRSIVKGIPGIANPSELVREAIHFVSNRKEGYYEWQAVGAFRKLLGKDGCSGWSTPFGMRGKK